MDRRARLVSDLRELGARFTGPDSGSGFRDLSLSDLEISDEEPMEVMIKYGMEEEIRSEFQESDSESDDGDIDEHLKLLWPRELEDLGVSALQVGQYDTAAKYFSTASLEWSEALVKRLANGYRMELNREALADSWVLNRYTQLAVAKGPFLERTELLQQFEAALKRTASISSSSASTASPYEGSC